MGHVGTRLHRAEVPSGYSPPWVVTASRNHLGYLGSGEKALLKTRPKLVNTKGVFDKHPAQGSEEDYMQYWYASRNKPASWLMSVMALTLILGIACGSAAQSPEAPEEPAQPVAPAAAEPAAAAPASSGASAPAAAAAPTAIPQQAAEPAQAMAEVADTTLTVMVGGWGGRFLPIHGTNCHNYFNIVHDFLVRSDENREYIPGMAESWKVSEDGLTWTVSIRDDGKFHDGRAVTAEDIYFNWLQQFGPGVQEVATSGSARRASQNVEKIELISDTEVSLTHINADSGFLGFISDTDGACQGVVTPGWELDKIHDESLIVSYDKEPVGAGIMSLVRHVQEEVMSFDRFDDYYYEDRRVPFRTLDLRKVSEEATRASALRAGEADIGPVSFDTKEQVVAGGGKIIVGQEGTYLRVILLGCYVPEIPCADKGVRQALSYAIDKEQMRDELWGGPEVMQVKGWASVTPGTIGYEPDLDPFPYDPDKARELLAAAGYKTPTNPDGRDFGTLVVNTWVSRAVPFLPESAQIAADFWNKELGIDAQVRVGDETNLKKETGAKGPLHGQVLWRDNETRRDSASISRSAYGTPPTASAKGSYVSEDPDIVQMVRNAMAVFDPEERHTTWHAVYQRMKDEQYELGIGYVNIQWGVSARVEDWKPLPQAFYPSALHTVVLTSGQ